MSGNDDEEETQPSRKTQNSGNSIKIGVAVVVGLLVLAVILYFAFLKPASPAIITCATGEDLVEGKCLIKCSDGQTRVAKICTNPSTPASPAIITCATGEDLVEGKCLIKCLDGQTRVGNICGCLTGTELIDGKCLIKCQGGQTLVGNRCEHTITDSGTQCATGMVRFGDVCIFKQYISSNAEININRMNTVFPLDTVKYTGKLISASIHLTFHKQPNTGGMAFVLTIQSTDKKIVKHIFQQNIAPSQLLTFVNGGIIVPPFDLVTGWEIGILLLGTPGSIGRARNIKMTLYIQP
jgi:hypothetical protein